MTLLKKLTASTAIVLCVGMSSSALASGTPTFDSSNLATAKQQLSAAQNQLSKLTEMQSLIESQLAAFGEFGVLKDLFGGSAFSGIGSQADFYENMQNFGFDPCAINLCKAETGASDNPAVSDIKEAKNWILKNFWSGQSLSDTQRDDLEEIRRRGVVNFSMNALALSTVVHNDLAGAGETAESLEEIVNSSQNMRGDIRANSAIAMAQYKAQIQQLAMLTAMVDILAMDQIKNDGLTYAGGGTHEFADAFIETDFSLSGRRSVISLPDMGSPDGGSSFNGGLVGRLAQGGGAASIADAISKGDIPGPAGDITSGLLNSDGLSAASNILSDTGNGTLATGLRNIQQGSGLFSGGDVEKGGSGVLSGIAGIVAGSNSNSGLQQIINTGTKIINTGNAGQATGFIQGAITDLTNSGNINDANYLKGQLEKLASGKISTSLGIMDAMALLSRNGGEANKDITRLLELDPTTLNDSSLSDLLRAAIRQAAKTTGNQDVKSIADTLAGMSDADIKAINDAIKNSENKASGSN